MIILLLKLKENYSRPYCNENIKKHIDFLMQIISMDIPPPILTAIFMINSGLHLHQ